MLAQCFFYFLILQPAFQGSHELYSPVEFALACLLTLIVASTGYIINDVLDEDIDLINRPEKLSVDSIMLLKRYVAIVLFGLVVNIVLCAIGPHWWYIWIYPVACFLMYLYSSHFKCQGLIGNVIVAIFSAAVVAILLLPLIDQMQFLTEGNYQVVTHSFIYFCLLGFMISLVREIVKDIEDKEGDAKSGCQTLPVKVGIKIAKYFAQFFLLALLISLIIWIVNVQSYYQIYHFAYLILFVIIPLLYISFLLAKAKEKVDFSKISSYLKYVMLSGILFVVFIQINI